MVGHVNERYLHQRMLRLAASTAIVMTALQACSDSTHVPTPSQPTSGASRPAPISAGAEYVAIGDSYTTAPGIGPATAQDGCAQSGTNYPRLVAEQLRIRLTDVSCSGASTQQATTAQVLSTAPRRLHPPQANAVTRSTDLVTISLGANDFLTFATVVSYCTSLRASDPTGAPCTAATNATRPSLDERTETIRNRLTAVIRLVAKRAPRARIVVVGYPRLFPSTGPCPQLPLAAGDFALAERINEQLVQAQRDAAKKTHVDYVDVLAATTGHDMCAADPWIAGVAPRREEAWPFHPYAQEQRVVAKLLIDAVTS